MAGFDKLIIDKWSPFVEKHLNIKNRYFKYLCCHYFHYHRLQKDDISNEVLNFKERISKMMVFKKKIQSEYINLLTGRKEYLLEDGTIYDTESLDVFLSTDELVKIFGIEFITHLDPTLSRDIKINKLLNDDRE